MSNVNLLLGRIIIGIYFLVFGAIFKLFNYEFTLNYMFDHQVPYTEISLIITIILQGICSISILVGYYSKSSAFVLALLTILINYYMHDFWNMSDDNKFGLLCISEEKDCWIVREDCKYYSELWIDSKYEGNEDLNRKCVLKMESGLFNLDYSKEVK